MKGLVISVFKGTTDTRESYRIKGESWEVFISGIKQINLRRGGTLWKFSEDGKKRKCLKKKPFKYKLIPINLKTHPFQTQCVLL